MTNKQPNITSKNINLIGSLVSSIMRNQPTLEPVQSMPMDAIAQMLYDKDPAYREDAAANHPLMTYQRGLDQEALFRNVDRRLDLGAKYTYGGNPNDPDRYFRNPEGYALTAKDMLDRAKFSNSPSLIGRMQ